MRAKTALILATFFGSGLISPMKGFKSMAGTYGSLAALPLCVLAVWLCSKAPTTGYSIILYVLVMFGVFLLGLESIPKAERELGTRTSWRGDARSHDQPQIVIDEVLGMLVACMPMLWLNLSFGWSVVAFAAAFVFFRLFDITKLWPIRAIELSENPSAVMLDDVFGGMYAGFVVASASYGSGYLAISVFLVLASIATVARK